MGPVGCAAEGRQGRGQHLRRAAVDRGQHRLLLVGEVGVEGREGDRGARGDVVDSHRRVALLGDHRGERPQDPLGRVIAAPGAEPPRPGGSAAGAAAPAAAGRRGPSPTSAGPARSGRPPRPGRAGCGSILRMPPITARTISGGISSRPGIRCRVVADEVLEGVGRAVHLLDRPRPGRVDLDEAHPRGRRLLDDQADQRFEGAAGALLRPGGSLPAAVGDGVRWSGRRRRRGRPAGSLPCRRSARRRRCARPPRARADPRPGLPRSPSRRPPRQAPRRAARAGCAQPPRAAAAGPVAACDRAACWRPPTASSPSNRDDNRPLRHFLAWLGPSEWLNSMANSFGTQAFSA